MRTRVGDVLCRCELRTRRAGDRIHSNDQIRLSVCPACGDIFQRAPSWLWEQGGHDEPENRCYAGQGKAHAVS